MKHMTQEQLQKAGELSNQIHVLRASLPRLTNSRIFQGLDSMGSHQIADAFLAETEVDTRKFAADKVLAKIKQLEDEFAKL